MDTDDDLDEDEVMHNQGVDLNLSDGNQYCMECTK